MKVDFEEIYETREYAGGLIVRFKNGSNASYGGHEKETFMKQYRIWLSQQESPSDRICDLDKYDEDGFYSRDIESKNKRKVMYKKEREKFNRTEENFDGVVHLMNSVTTLQNKTQTYIDEIVQFQKDAIMAMKDNQAFLSNSNVTKWELKRLKSLIDFTSECRGVGKKINAVTLTILEDWII